jgi:FADH2 O2-dependent halogenase
MNDVRCDVAVIGAGFSGCLTALLLRQLGLSSIVLDRGHHPRFAIGESSTPMANLILEDLARRYSLPRLLPLTNYADWKVAYPEIVCGLKRGFSYFHHTAGCSFVPNVDHRNELLVEASLSEADADTHWLRSDFDQFLAREAADAGVPVFEGFQIASLTADAHGWHITGTRPAQPHSPPSEEAATGYIHASFLIDASGDGGFLARNLNIGAHPDGLRTRSRGLFSHFRDVSLWEPLYQSIGGHPEDHPFPCDDAALHHVFDGGWMWVLRFDNGVTSAGFALDPELFPLNPDVTPEEEWSNIMAMLPSVAEQFRHAKPCIPLRRTGPMQRRLKCASGDRWVMLPNTAAFLDPLHSTGNAWTLAGIERLIRIFEQYWKKPEFISALEKYDTTFQHEVEFLDEIVSGSYAGFREFDRMIAMSMFYFSTATWSEAKRRGERSVPGAAFLSADHPALRDALRQAGDAVRDESVSTTEFTEFVKKAVSPFNRVGLFNPDCRNLYRHG